MLPDCKAIFIVTVDVDPSVEDGWNKWYDEVHVPAIAACPGFLQGTRWVQEDDHGDRHYFTVWELSGLEALDGAQFKAQYGWGGFEDGVKHFTLNSYARRVAGPTWRRR
jgi:Domain of unknown function (DUF4286)